MTIEETERRDGLLFPILGAPSQLPEIVERLTQLLSSCLSVTVTLAVTVSPASRGCRKWRLWLRILAPGPGKKS